MNIGSRRRQTCSSFCNCTGSCFQERFKQDRERRLDINSISLKKSENMDYEQKLELLSTLKKGQKMMTTRDKANTYHIKLEEENTEQLTFLDKISRWLGIR